MRACVRVCLCVYRERKSLCVCVCVCFRVLPSDGRRHLRGKRACQASPFAYLWPNLRKEGLNDSQRSSEKEKRLNPSVVGRTETQWHPQTKAIDRLKKRGPAAHQRWADPGVLRACKPRGCVRRVWLYH